MLRIGVLLTALTFTEALAGYPDGSTENNLSTGQSSSTSYGYGYSGSFNAGAPPNMNQFDFQGFLNNYLESINKYHQEFIKNLQAATLQAAHGVPQQVVGGGGASGGANSATAGGSATAGSFGGSFAAPGGGGGFNFPSIGPAGAAPNIFGRFGAGGQEGAGGGAVASAAIGPDGVQQTAAVYPENPNSPNVNTHFAGAGQPGGGGFRSVFTSSSSQTTNNNGQQKTVQQASTTVNDNGKVTTYTVKNP